MILIKGPWEMEERVFNKICEQIRRWRCYRSSSQFHDACTLRGICQSMGSVAKNKDQRNIAHRNLNFLITKLQGLWKKEHSWWRYFPTTSGYIQASCALSWMGDSHIISRTRKKPAICSTKRILLLWNEISCNLFIQTNPGRGLGNHFVLLN